MAGKESLKYCIEIWNRILYYIKCISNKTPFKDFFTQLYLYGKDEHTLHEPHICVHNFIDTESSVSLLTR